MKKEKKTKGKGKSKKETSIEKKLKKKLREKNKGAKVLIEVSEYKKKKTNQKKWVRVIKCKDGSYTRYGVSRNGRRFKEKIYKNVKSEKILKKIFNKAKNKKDGRRNNITLVMKIYKGKYYAKNKSIKGDIMSINYYNIDKKLTRESKGKIFLYTNDVNVLIQTLAQYNQSYEAEFLGIEPYNMEE
jgi:hypothetical protein